MAEVTFIEPSAVQIRSGLRKSDVNQNQLLAKNIARVLTQSIDTKHLVPVSLLGAIQKSEALAVGRRDKAQKALARRQQKSIQTDFDKFSEPDKVAGYLTEHVSFMRRQYRDHWVALLKAMDHLLLHPEIQMSQMDVHARKSVPLVMPDRTEIVPLDISWAGLAKRTLREKKKLSAPSRVFWRHTLKGRSAFHDRVRQRIASAQNSNPFSSLIGYSVTDIVTPKVVQERVQVLQTLPKQGRNQYAAEATFHYRIGVPDLGDPRLNALITIPFTTGKTDLGVFQRATRVRERGTNILSLQGLDRLMRAEAFRPWLRQLSAAARASLLRSVQAGLVSRGQSNINLSGARNAQRVKGLADFNRIQERLHKKVTKSQTVNRVRKLKTLKQSLRDSARAVVKSNRRIYEE